MSPGRAAVERTRAQREQEQEQEQEQELEQEQERQRQRQGTAARPLRALVIGYGSPIRGDDALGPLVADRLQERFSRPPPLNSQAQTQTQTGMAAGVVEVQARHILTAELVDDLARAERVIFVDAAIDTPPGQVRCRRLSPDRSALSSMAHFHDPGELLAWCEALYQRAPEAWLVSGGGAEWGYACYALSEIAQQALEPMIAEVISLIDPECRRGSREAAKTRSD